MKRRHVIAAAGLSLAAPSLRAQEAWPSRPVRLVVGWPPGGSVDLLARALQPRLQARLGQPIVVENRPGATATLGAAEVARAAPDGHTWLLAVDSHVITPAIMPLPYDIGRDFAPVMLVGRGPLLVAAHPGAPWADFPALVAAARAAPPNTIPYATAGIGTMMHVAMVQLCNRAGIELSHIPYRGGAPALADALAGQVPLFVTNAPVGGPHVRRGALRGLGVTTRARWRDLPEVPSFEEIGFAGFEAPTWWAAYAPAGVPRPILARMEAALADALAEPETRARVEALGMDVMALTGEPFASFAASEAERWRQVVIENRIRLEG
jgi:tripartite-type tricarboxylate transporter receptor subunit TctC